MEQGTPQSRLRRQADISPKLPSQAWIRSYVEDDDHGDHRKFIRQHNQEPTQQRAPSLSAASPISEDSQVKPKSTHASKQAEATQVEPPPPSEAPTGMSLPNQALLALLRLRAFFVLCPLDTVARLARTCTMIRDPAVAAHLTFRTETLHRLWTGLNSHPGESPSGHHNRRWDEAESRQQQKKHGMVACKRSKEGGTWREPRQLERPPKHCQLEHWSHPSSSKFQWAPSQYRCHRGESTRSPGAQEWTLRGNHYGGLHGPSSRTDLPETSC